jgi:8-oxo-dGDP phosphatase
MDPIQRVSSREVYRNNWLSVREDSVRRLDGSEGIYAVVDKPTCAVVIPLDDGGVHLVEQFRYPLGLRRWEFPMGTAPDLADVPPPELAVLELREETGLIAGSMVDIGTLDVAAGMSSQRGRVFLATELTQGDAQRELEEQDMRTAWFERDEFEKMIFSGEITDAQTLAAYMLLLFRERG